MRSRRLEVSYSGGGSVVRRRLVAFVGLIAMIAALPALAVGPSAARVAVPDDQDFGRHTDLVSVHVDGGNACAQDFPLLSRRARYVAFRADFCPLVPADDDEGPDVYLVDHHSGATWLVSRTPDGTAAPNNDSLCGLSADGRFVALQSNDDLARDGIARPFGSLYVFDRDTGSMRDVALDSAGQPIEVASGCSLSPDGHHVAFVSAEDDLVPNDDNDTYDVFLKDLPTGTLRLVSAAADGTPANENSGSPIVSRQGRFVAFQSSATDLLPGRSTELRSAPYVRRMSTGRNHLVARPVEGPPPAEDVPWLTDMSPDGRFVTFYSDQSSYVPGDTNGRYDVFVRDRRAGATELVSLAADGGPGHLGAIGGSLSASGRYVAFKSGSTLVPGDTNRNSDVYVRDRVAETTVRASLNRADQQVRGGSSFSGVMSRDGTSVSFSSFASGFVPGDDDGGGSDVYIRFGADRDPLAVR